MNTNATSKKSVRELREARGWNQLTLASQANVSLGTISRAERGEPILLLLAESICRALEMEVDHVDIQIVNRIKRAK